jgi:hypothetical protein
MRHSSGGLAALLYGPCKVSTTVQSVRVQIEEKTHYPFENIVEIAIQPEHETEFPILLRDPEWSNGTTVKCDGATVSREGSYWLVTKKWKAGDTVHLEFLPSVREVPAVNGEVAIQYGALLFVQPIEAHKQVIKTYPVPGFEDAYYLPTAGKYQAIALPASLRWKGFGFKPLHVSAGVDPLRPFDQPTVMLQGRVIRQADNTEVDVALVPLGNAATLRRVTFPISP